MHFTQDTFWQQAEVKTYLYQMLYSSVLKQSMSPSEIDVLVKNAQRSNQEAGITGMLMMDAGIVVQWLEGDKSVVRELWAKLQRDPRHECMVELMHREYQEKRLYPNWSMHLTTRQNMLAIVHQAREQHNYGIPNPWAPAIDKLCELLDNDAA